MRGPAHKIKLDVRRTWKCPACGRERKKQGDVTTMTCDCRTEGVFMKIASERTVPQRPYQNVSEMENRSRTFGIDDMPVWEPNPNWLPPESSLARRPRPGSAARNADDQLLQCRNDFTLR